MDPLAETLKALYRALQKLSNSMKATDIYTVASQNLGRHLTLNNAVSPEVGCAEAVSFVLLNAGFAIPTGGIPTVNGLIAWMLANGFVEVANPAPGDVITKHSPDHGNPNGAHIGICARYGILSNTSSNGLFQENYSYLGWEADCKNNGLVSRVFSAVDNSA